MFVLMGTLGSFNVISHITYFQKKKKRLPQMYSLKLMTSILTLVLISYCQNKKYEQEISEH